MLPSKQVIDQDVQLNYDEMFKDVKLNKKAEKKVRDLLTNAICLSYKLRQAISIHNQVTELHNLTSNTFSHQFVDKSEVKDESSN